MKISEEFLKKNGLYEINNLHPNSPAYWDGNNYPFSPLPPLTVDELLNEIDTFIPKSETFHTRSPISKPKSRKPKLSQKLKVPKLKVDSTLHEVIPLPDGINNITILETPRSNSSNLIGRQRGVANRWTQVSILR